jgi:hypothetical protein
MTNTSKPDILTTCDALYQEYINNHWKERLERCSDGRKDYDTEFAADEGPYRRRKLSRHYESNILVAFTIEYLHHDGHSTLKVKMLLIDGVRHICR